MTDVEKKERLLQLIDALCQRDFSKDDTLIRAWIDNLNDIYANGYRHTYSDIFFKVQSIKKLLCMLCFSNTLFKIVLIYLIYQFQMLM